MNNEFRIKNQTLTIQGRPRGSLSIFHFSFTYLSANAAIAGWTDWSATRFADEYVPINS